MREITEIIVHCSATAENRPFTEKDIDRWHRARGFRCIGYHYVILLDGRIRPGRDISQQGAHCLGHNARSIGVCYIGGCAADGQSPKDTRTKAQRDSLHYLLKTLRRTFPKARIRSHRDFANKACPSFDATAEYANL